LEKAGSALSPLVREFGLEGSLSLHRLKAEWDTLFEGPLSQHTLPYRHAEGRLLVLVDSPVWIQQLSFLKAEMLRKLRGFGVKDLGFRLGAVVKRPGRRAAAPPAATEDDIALIDEVVSATTNPELKERIRRAMEKSLPLTKMRQAEGRRR
jgi:hypothetical protein